MTGDRRLRPHEMKIFMEHGSIGMNTLKEMLFTGGEPTLFEVALIEISAKLGVHTDLLIEYGAKIKALMSLELNIRLALRRLDELDESLEEHKQLLMDQINELKQLAEEFENASIC